jgi:anti-sigma-K factor RskA
MSEELQLLVAGYVLGDLDPEEAAAFEPLLADPAIAAEVDKMQNAIEMAYGLPEVGPPPQLRAAILASASDQQPLQSIRDSQSRPPQTQRWPRRNLGWGQALAVAAAALIVALGISNYRLWQTLQAVQSEIPSETPSEAPQPALTPALTYVLQAPQTGSTASAASATVTVDPNRLEGRLTAQTLPPLPPGKTYALWTVLEQGAPFTVDSKKAILTEVFQVDAAGNATETITVPAVYRAQNLVAAVAITVENTASPQQHIGKPLLITN